MRRDLFYTLLTVCLLLENVLCFSQKENLTWYFGFGAGMTFNNPGFSPTPLTDGNLFTVEGCASLCDKVTGDLLFYTDGISVYNRNHNVMTNGFGLMGNSSSTQAAIIVPDPAAVSRYYIFTSGEYYSNGGAGVRYSVVDMTLDGGLGDLVQKNTLLHSLSAEKLCATSDSDGKGYWIISHSFTGTDFYIYHLTDSGITSSVQPIGYSFSGNDAVGCIRFSPDGHTMAMAIRGQDVILIYDFDKATGELSNEREIPAFAGTSHGTYGVCFSPDGTMLYATAENSPDILQFNLSLSSLQEIISSKKIIATVNNYGAHTMQIGPDGKIYVAKNSRPDLGVIHFPNLEGTACQYEDDGFHLSGRTSGYGLPAYPDNMIHIPEIISTGICSADSITFTISDTTGVDNVSWNFGDVNSSANTSNDIIANHLYSTGGIFPVEAILKYKGGNSRVIQKEVQLIQTPDFSLGNDTLLCEGNSISLSSPSLYEFIWSDQSTIGTYQVNQTGKYWITVSDSICFSSDTINITFQSCCPVEVPNLITPNKDNRNDLFHISCQDKIFYVEIYNRWGKRIFQSETYDNNWAGEEPGVYFYYIRDKNSGRELRGWVQVIN